MLVEKRVGFSGTPSDLLPQVGGLPAWASCSVLLIIASHYSMFPLAVFTVTRNHSSIN